MRENVGKYEEMETNLKQMETKYWQKMEEKEEAIDPIVKHVEVNFRYLRRNIHVINFKYVEIKGSPLTSNRERQRTEITKASTMHISTVYTRATLAMLFSKLNRHVHTYISANCFTTVGTMLIRPLYPIFDTLQVPPSV
mgnify:CR=1 FL=1